MAWRADVLMDAVLIPVEPGEIATDTYLTGRYLSGEVLLMPPAGNGYLLADPLGDPNADECEPVVITGLGLPVGRSGASSTTVPSAGGGQPSGAAKSGAADSGAADPGANGSHAGASGAGAGGPGTAGASGNDRIASRRFEEADSITMKRSGKGRGARFKAMRPLVVVTVPVMTLLGHSDQAGELQGYGPIDPDTAREIAAHAPSFVRLLTDCETGVVLSMSKKRYKPPKDLRTWLQIRDETCRSPGCNRSAMFCDIDHTLDWAKGGTTDHTNLASLCKADHKLKHEFGWTVTQTLDGVLNWVSPTGLRYSTQPETPIHVPLPTGFSNLREAGRSETSQGPSVSGVDEDSPPPF